jgi:hypothetical protein
MEWSSSRGRSDLYHAADAKESTQKAFVGYVVEQDEGTWIIWDLPNSGTYESAERAAECRLSGLTDSSK